MLTRRQAVLGGALVIGFGAGTACSCAAHAQAPSPGHVPRRQGCILSGAQARLLLDNATEERLYVTGNEPMISRSGDRYFDQTLARMLAKASAALQILPGFAYYDDKDGPNAYATPHVRLNNTDGTVLFGQALLRRLMQWRENPEVAVAAVCAHEFGHILQFRLGLHRILGGRQPTVKRIELQADFFAGYFAGIRKLQSPGFPAAVFAMTQHNFGENMINSPRHHGTPDERAAAISQGFHLAYGERRSLDAAIQISTNYVRTL